MIRPKKKKREAYLLCAINTHFYSTAPPRISAEARLGVILCRQREDTAQAKWAGSGATRRRDPWGTCIASTGKLRRYKRRTWTKKRHEGGPTGDAQAIRISTAPPSPDFKRPGMSYRAGGAMIRRRQHGRALAQTNGEIDGEPVLPTAGGPAGNCDATNGGHGRNKEKVCLPAMRNQHTSSKHGRPPGFQRGQARHATQAAR